MSATTRRRLDAATGVTFVVLITVALALPGTPPKAQDSIEAVTAVVLEHRRAVLISGYIGGLAAMAYLWFLGTVRSYLDASAVDEAAEASKFGFGLFLLASVPLVLVSAVALFAERGLFQLGGVIDVGGAIPALLWIAALSVVMMRGVSAPGVAAIAGRIP